MRGAFRRWAFPAQPRPLPHGRRPSIALRSIDLAAFGILLGGHALGVEPALLRPYLSVTVLSGVGLLALEAYFEAKCPNYGSEYPGSQAGSVARGPPCQRQGRGRQAHCSTCCRHRYCPLV
jgi:hypothetical protein